MPQLTLRFGGNNKQLSLSPQKPRTTSSFSNTAAGSSSSPTTSPTRSFSSSKAKYYTKRGDEPNLWELHHIQEDMAATSKSKATAKAKSQASAQAEGKDVKAHDEEGEASFAGHAGDGEGGKGEDEVKDGGRAKGLPTSGKRGRADSPEGGGVAGSKSKKAKNKNAYEIKGKIATKEDAARVDADPPLDQLMRLQKEDKKKVEKGESVVYWMRMEDLRIEDNTALALASDSAKKLRVPLIALFVLSPGDYKWHDRAPFKIDFILRNLRYLKGKLDDLNIPLHIVSYDRRLSIPRRLVTEVFPKLKATHVFANIEYEVDELRRDIATVRQGRQHGIDVICVHDRLVVPPGRITSKVGKPMSVFSPWQRAWARLIEQEPDLLNMSPDPEANDASIRSHPDFGSLFESTPVPDHVEGFECPNPEKVHEAWPEGSDRAKEILDRFLFTKARKQQFQFTSPLNPGEERDPKKSRIQEYQVGRNLVDADNSSKLSPYLAAGVLSGRMVCNEAKKIGKGGKLESGRDSGIGMWVQEVSWRDFYNHVMATWPRVSMGRPFLEKFADVQWEVNEEHLQIWKDGKTGYPIVDAAMRACKARGWMENRVRMVAACFLVKDLMLDWRLGEKYFMESFIDGDLAANNGGWQWTASTGTDPQPYFRIFNTITQSEKCDPNGDYIRYWVPELKNLKGKAIHDPFHNMPRDAFKKLGYPEPIVDHKVARERTLFRYKNVGEREPGAAEADE